MTDLLSQTLVKSRFCRLGFENASSMNIPNQQRFKTPLRVRPLARHPLLKFSSDSSFTLNSPITQPTVNQTRKLTVYDNITFADRTLRGRKPQWVLLYSHLSQHLTQTRLKSGLLRLVLPIVLVPAQKKLSENLAIVSCHCVSFARIDTIYIRLQSFIPCYGVRDSPVKPFRYLQNLYIGISWKLVGEYLQFMEDTS